MCRKGLVFDTFSPLFRLYQSGAFVVAIHANTHFTEM